MQNNLREISPLRQMLDILGAQLEEKGAVDGALVATCVRNIVMAATDAKTPLPADVFQPGLSDALMRLALSSMCAAILQMMTAKSPRL
jgi:hypothetical protein